jgi:MFS transporter, PPP family, 3-phenylpropionic acid transporter
LAQAVAKSPGQSRLRIFRNHKADASRPSHFFAAISPVSSAAENLKRDERRHISLAYLLYFATFGLYLPYFPPFLKDRGIDGLQIGILLAAAPLLRALLPPFWGYLADRWKGPSFWSTVAAWGAVAGMTILVVSQSFPALLLGGIIYYASIAPMIPLLDAGALSHLAVHRGAFGRLRLWGSVGFIVTSFGLGIAFPELPGTIIAVALLGSHLLFALYMTLVPVQKNIPSQPDWNEFKALLRIAPLLILLGAIFLNRFGGAGFTGFYTLYVQDLGFGGHIVAWTWGIAVVTEVFVMLVVDRFIERIGITKVLVWGMLLEALRWFAYATAPSAPTLLLLAPLHGIGFAFLYVASVRRIADIVPDKLRSSGQGLAAAATGLGQMAGLVIAGYAFDVWGSGWMFVIGGGAALAGALAAMLTKPRD